MKLLSGLRLLLTHPGSFKHRARDVLINRRVENKLKRLASTQDKEIWENHCGIDFLFSNDGDAQEILYHANFTQWYERTRRDFSRWLKKADIAVDVGANMGFTSVVISQLVGSGGIVHSFEPSPRIYEKLRKIVDRNHLTNVVCHNQGCGRRTERLELWTPESSGNASLRPATDIVGRTLRKDVVEIRAIDEDLGPKLQRLDFLKIDTEGFEIDVLAGSANTIARHQPVIYIELSAEYRESSQSSIEWLKSRDYVFTNEPNLDQAHNGDNFFAVPHSRI
jgi:FkbM family methyltransferase